MCVPGHNRQMYRRLTLSCIGIALLGLLPGPGQTARASLGGDIASVGEDAAALSGTDAVTAQRDFDLHVVTTATGMRVTEYVDQRGRVFAVSWTGPVQPDLHVLLGTHYAAFAAALAAQPAYPAQGMLRVATPELIVENGGHMRAISGRACIPAWLPAGMTVADVR